MHAQTCLVGREKHDAGVHWTPRDYSRVNFKQLNCKKCSV